jgi:dehydrogenase/reductase SDR family member 7B
MKVEGRVAWITGASSGIGEALALRLAERGARVILSARRRERLEAVAARCGTGRAAVLPVDAADTASLAGKAAEAETIWGRVDLLVNNAGVSQRSLFVETDPAVMRRLLEIDLLAPILLTRAVLPSMVERRSGHIVFVSSLVGKVGTPLRTIYSASKHGLQGLGEALRAEVARHGIGVTLAVPGFVRTEVSLAALHADGVPHGVMDPGQDQGITAEACAAAVVAAIERGRREVLVGMGGRGTLALVLRALAPGLLARVLRGARVT